MEGSTNDSLFMLAAKQVLFGPWMFLNRTPGGHGISPNPTVTNKLSSIPVGTSALLGLLRLVVNFVAVAVSLKAGKVALTGLIGPPTLAGHGAVSYSSTAVVVVLSNGAPWPLA